MIQGLEPYPRIVRIPIRFYKFFIYGFKLGDGFRNKWKLIYIFFLWKLITIVSKQLHKVLPLPKKINIIFHGRPLLIHVPNVIEFGYIFYDIFVNQIYEIDFVQPPQCILDVGAHVGLASLYYLCLYPNATIHAFEPNSANFRYLKQNTQPFEKIRTYQIGLYSHSGTAQLHLQEQSVDHSLLRQGPGEEITTTTLDEFIASQEIDHVDVLKIDAEGAEEAILTTTQSLKDIVWIVGEFHFELINKQRVMDTLNKYFKVDYATTGSGLAVFKARNVA